MSNGRRVHNVDRTAVVAISTATLTKHLGRTILLLALAGLVTQCLALATGLDFVFGLIPKLNPAGTRNIQVWFASVAFAVCAAVAAVTALTIRPTCRKVGPWHALSVVLTVLSAERLASVIGRYGSLASGPNTGSPLLVLMGLTAAVMLTVYGWCIYDLPRKIQVHFVSSAAIFVAGVTLCAFAAQPADALQQRIMHMLMMSVGRLLELAGIALFLEAGAMNLLSRVREIRVVVDSSLARLLESRVVAGALVIRLSPRRIQSVLVAAAVVLLAAGLAAALARETAGWEIEGVYRLLGLDFEGNLPTWYSSLLLLACAIWLACIAAARYHPLDLEWRPWAMLGFLFAGMSADEAAGLHELSVVPLRSMLGGNAWLHYPLILPGLIVALLVYRFFARFVGTLPAETRRQIFLGFGLILVGALGIETVGGWFDPLVHGPSVTYALLATVEEGVEMIGTIIVLGAVMRHIEHNIGTLTIPGGARPAPGELVGGDVEFVTSARAT